MRSRPPIQPFVTAGALLAALCGPSASGQCQYEVTAVFRGAYCGPDLGYSPTWANDINARGFIAGFYDVCFSGQGIAFFGTPEGNLPTVPPPRGATSASAWAINDETHVVGAFSDPGPHGPFAFLWESGQAIDLGTLPGGDFSRAFAINSSGQIVGRWGNQSFGPAHGFLWQDGAMMDFGPTLRAAFSSALGINDYGQVAGWRSDGPIDTTRAFIWDQGRVTILDTIPGGSSSEAYAINNQGCVVGSGKWTDPATGDTYTRAFSWLEGEMINLGALPGYLHSHASDISDLGVIVGNSWGGVGSTSVILWPGGVLQDLDILVMGENGSVRTAVGINNQGQIAASGPDAQGNVVGYLLSPLPSIFADLTCDGRVLRDDLLILLEIWGPCYACPADLDGDGVVGTSDLLMLLANWG